MSTLMRAMTKSERSEKENTIEKYYDKLNSKGEKPPRNRS